MEKCLICGEPIPRVFVDLDNGTQLELDTLCPNCAELVDETTGEERGDD